MQVKKMNSDVIKYIFDKDGVDGLIKAIHDYNTYRYEQAYRDGYIHGRGIGYQNGKFDGYAKAVNKIMKER